jgi:hypothetical protein
MVVPDRKRREALASAVAMVENSERVRCLATDDLVSALEAVAPTSSTITKTAGGYKVNVTRRVVSYQDMQERQSTVAEVIAKSIMKQRKRD